MQAHGWDCKPWECLFCQALHLGLISTKAADGFRSKLTLDYGEFQHESLSLLI